MSLSSSSTSTVPRFNPGYFPPQFFPWFNLGHFPPATSFGSSGKSMAPPPAFMEQMVHDRARWANGIADAGVVRAIARAVAGTCLPWHADWSNWRAHASDFFRRLCSHRMVRASQTDAVIQSLQERITALENAVAKLQTAKAAAPVLVGASHNKPEEDIGVSNYEEDIGVSVLRAQLRAVASRSPEPRRAVSQLLGVTVAGNGEARSLPDVPLS